MGLRQFLAMIGIMIIALVGTPGVRCSPTLGSKLMISQDTLRPEISAWGIVGDPSSDNSFSVWANVSDSGTGVRNVSLVTQQDTGNTTVTELLRDGPLYTHDIPGLPVNHTYTLYILAFDLANNSATSYSVTVDTHPTPPATFDPNSAMPVVVVSSLLLGGLTILLAIVYHRCNLRALE
ncbi:MAG: hypothetical protein K9W43_10470 [Candidatus Thorarchaeota archaeon]|nr:hypothetical protein [Candidatus Thorarchaeota archaeon]